MLVSYSNTFSSPSKTKETNGYCSLFTKRIKPDVTMSASRPSVSSCGWLVSMSLEGCTTVCAQIVHMNIWGGDVSKFAHLTSFELLQFYLTQRAQCLLWCGDAMLQSPLSAPVSHISQVIPQLFRETLSVLVPHLLTSVWASALCEFSLK